MSKVLGAAKLRGASLHRVEPDRALVLYRDRPQTPINGVGRLPAAMTINGITEYPVSRYTGGGGLATVAAWAPWGYGQGASQVAVGTAMTPDWGSPLRGPLDDSVRFNGSDYYQEATSIVNSNHDRVYQLFLRMPTNTGTLVVCGTGRGGALVDGWNFYTAANNLRFSINDGVTNVVIGPVTLSAMAWYYIEVYYHHGGNARLFVNGVDASGAVSVAGLGNVTDTSPITLGANQDGSLPYTTGNLGYFAYYQRAAWLDTSNQTTLAELNASLIWGWRPQQARGTAVPSVRTRASDAYLDVLHSNGTRRLYFVGQNVPRVVERLSKTGRKLRGYLPEPQITNILTRSEEIDVGASWTPTRMSVTNTSVTTLPNGASSVSDVMHEDNTAGNTHYLYHATGIASGTVYCISAFFKAINRTWVALNPKSGAGLSSAFFNIGTGVVGTVQAGLVGATSGIENWGNGWYRCWFRWEADVVNPGLAVYIGEADNDIVFDGANQDSIYAWGFQVEAGVDYPTSYTPTTATVIREEDILRYAGADGNLGGVGSNQRGQISMKMLCEDYNATVAKRLATLSDGGAAADTIAANVTTADVPNVETTATGGDAGSWTGTTDLVDGEVHELELPYKTNQLGPGRIDGAAEGAADTDCDMPDDLDRIDIGSSGTNSEPGCVLGDIEFFATEERRS